MQRIEPILVNARNSAQCSRLEKHHAHFDEAWMQEFLVAHPEVLPVKWLYGDIGMDIGELLCIGREVAVKGAGSIDNLYLSTGGYVVVVKTKLWRNPQARREVLSQTIDYVTSIVTRDFEWLEGVWSQFCREEDLPTMRLIEAIQQLDEEIDEGDFINRVLRGLRRGHVIALIVGDGIEERLQQLVAHLTNSAHLCYSLGLVSLRCFQMPGRD